MSLLFTPLKLGPVELSNRIVVSPLCQRLGASGTYPRQDARAKRSIWPGAAILQTPD
jgi:2,4-dienoyl-CoA reductase-like NADH-dependent reductase (Old Yellow Enzyme family)